MDQEQNLQIAPIHQSLQRLIGLHRQLMDVVRMERDALAQADIKGIEEATHAKQAVVEAIRGAENERVKAVAALAIAWRRPLRELTLKEIIIAVQGRDPKVADQLRTTLNALTILVSRVAEQNSDNKLFVERAIGHVEQMKKNVLGESVPKSNTYTQQGQRSNPVSGARLISKEA